VTRRIPNSEVAETREHIGAKVRELRLARHWTQIELARHLGLSQARLSEIERGGGSFTAEQLLLILRLFNVDIGEFSGAVVDDQRDLQNALVRYGAAHLREDPNAAVTARYRSAADVVRAVLLNPGSERWVTALSPVLVRSIDEVPLPALQSDLVSAGVPNRLGWLVENTLEALRDLPGADHAQSPWAQRARRAEVVLSSFLQHLRPIHPEWSDGGVPDPFDQGIRSTTTLRRVWDEASLISRRWGIASSLRVEDFRRALGGAHESRR